MIRIIFQGEQPNELWNFFKRSLECQGFRVEQDGDWETVGSFCKRMGMKSRAFWRIRSRQGCPYVEHAAGPTGRWVRLKPTKDLERFCKLHMQTHETNPIT